MSFLTRHQMDFFFFQKSKMVQHSSKGDPKMLTKVNSIHFMNEKKKAPTLKNK